MNLLDQFVANADIKFTSFSAGVHRYVVGYDTGATDEITETVAAGGNPTQWIVDLLTKLASPGDGVLDLGAHIGCFSLAAASLGFDVTAFEASTRNTALQFDSIQRNGFTNLRLVEAAVAGASRELDFFSSGPHGHLVPAGPRADTVKVRGVAIDDYLSQVKGTRISFIKMDVEGAEIEAVAGMRGLLSGPKAPAVVFESNSTTLSRSGQTTAKLRQQFTELGFNLYVIVPGYFCELSPIPPGFDQKPKLIDCLAVKRPLSWLQRHSLRNLPGRIVRRLGLRPIGLDA